MKSTIIFLMFLGASSCISAECLKDYCLPGLPCWPTEANIAAFKGLLNGTVLQPFDTGYTDAVSLDNRRLVKSPGVVVLAQTDRDVQLAVLFANNYNIRLTVRPSSYDRTGRSSAHGSLQINLSFMQRSEIRLDDNRHPDGTIALQAGNTWNKVYQEVNGVGRVLVGSLSSTETVGGFTEGGGHGPLSRSLGLAVDSLLAIDIVTAEGSLVSATADRTTERFLNGSAYEVRDSDLFWAVRGGGSTTFGIVTSFVFKLHSPPRSMVSVLCAYPFVSVQGTDTGRRVLSTYMNSLPSLPSEWGGYLMTTKADPNILVGTKTMLFAVLLHYGPWDSPSRSAIEPLLSQLTDVQFSCQYTNVSTFWNWKRNFTTDVFGRHSLTNVFLQYGSLRPEVVDIIANSTEGPLTASTAAELSCTISLLGGKMENVPADSSAVSAAYRTALASATCHTAWSNPTEDNVNTVAIRELGEKLRKYTKGVSVNEPDQHLSNWKDEFWGGQYSRLVEEKNVWDPNNVFYCRHCVGSDSLGVTGCNDTTVPVESNEQGVTVDRQQSDFSGPKFCSRYCTPGHTCWPSRTEVSRLASSLDGKLLTPNMQGYRETVRMKDTLYTKHPGIVILPLTTPDVQKAIVFAKKHNIRITVLSSGHDYNGKSTADGSLQINFSNMKKRMINMNDPRSKTGESIYAETGNTWGDVYLEVYKVGRLVVGRSALTVALGGYTTGGGHSMFSRSLGLAVDNVVEFQIVLADGTVATATANGTIFEAPDGTTGRSPSTDLFWAVLGGGGGTFGVVTSFTYQLHTPPSQLVSWSCFYPVNVGSNDIGKNVTTFFNSLIPNLSSKWGGYYILRQLDPNTNNGAFGSISLILIHYGPWGEPSVDDIRPMMNFLPQYQVYCGYKNETSYFEYKKNSTDPIYYRTYVTNTLLQEDSFTPELTETLAGGLATPSLGEFGCTGVLIGGKVSEVVDTVTSVGGTLRTALNSLTCGWGWEDPTSDSVNIQVAKAFGERLHRHGRGVYYNEPDIYLPTWKSDFWGKNYDRLLSIKQRWDRDNVFYCHHCVGSDLVDNFSCNETNEATRDSQLSPPETASCSTYNTLVGPAITDPLSTGVSFCSRYCLIGNPCWPTEASIAELGVGISGTVTTPSSPDFGTDFPNDTISTSPGILVKPNDIGDIQKALLFGRDNNLQIIPISLGRASQEKSASESSLEINLSNMTEVRVNPNDPSSPTGSSVAVNSGSTWEDVYREVDRFGKVIVGSNRPTVHIDDFAGSGGLGPLSRALGLAADNILSFRIVLPDGRIADASKSGALYLYPNGTVVETRNTDLFWAVRGGGADTFGIVPDITFALHDAPSGFVHYVGMWRMNNGNDTSHGLNMLEQFHRTLPQLSPTWGGELVSFAERSDNGVNGTIAVSLLHFGKASSTTTKDLELISSFAPLGQVMSQVFNYSTYWEFQQNAFTDLTGNSRNYKFNTFLQYDSDPSHVAEFIVNVTMDSGACTENLIGGKVSEAVADSAAINPAFRTGLSSLTCSFTWNDPTDKDRVVAMGKDYGERIQELGQGVYANDAMSGLSNGQQDIWGQHYGRLMGVKERYDPYFLLNCEHCVGSDRVVEFYNETYDDTQTTTTTSYGSNFSKPTVGSVDFYENNEYVSRYCVRGLACWPTDAQFISLESSLDGNVLQPFETGFTQHAQLVNKLRSKSPGLIVFPRSVTDVQRAVLFARDHNLRVTIVSSGHTFNGKSTADGSLQINMSKMKRMTLNPLDTRSPTAESITVEGGVTWGEIYRKVNEWSRRAVVGPASLGVSVGGYSTGGGLSPISPSLGFAADNTLAFELVTADGRVVNATKTGTTITDMAGQVTRVADTDLFWALRGGGGGTFGVITSLTYQLHYAPPELVQFDCVFVPSGDPQQSLRDIINFFHGVLTTLPKQWGGKFIVSKSPTGGEMVTFAIIQLLHYGPWNSATRAAVEPFFSFRPEWQTSCNFATKNRFWDYAKGLKDLPYDRAYLSSGLYTPDKVGPQLTDAVIEAIFTPNGVRDAKTCTYDIIGGNGTNSTQSDAISPNLRQASVSVMCSVTWADNLDDVSNIAAGVEMSAALYRLTDGVYLNYAPYYLPNWKKDFWGSKYDNLLSIKKKWDPESFFYCRHCVGSELIENFREQTKTLSRPTKSPKQGETVTPAVGGSGVSLKPVGIIITMIFGIIMQRDVCN